MLNAAARLWQVLSEGLRPGRSRWRGPDDESPQMFLERIAREHRHSWLPSPQLSGPAYECSICGAVTAAVATRYGTVTYVHTSDGESL